MFKPFVAINAEIGVVIMTVDSVPHAFGTHAFVNKAGNWLPVDEDQTVFRVFLYIHISFIDR